MSNRRDPSPRTRELHATAVAELPPDDGRDLESARHGLVAAAPADLTITAPDGRVVWSLADYGFLRDSESAPDTVHPALWRLARLNLEAGLYEVADGVYQVRGYDLSNMAIVEGERGIIVVDPLISVECAASALALYYEHRGERAVTAVLYTHSHVDHFGGVRGVLDAGALERGGVELWAPEGFLEHAVSENVLAGVAMTRRATYMYGAALDRGARGQLDAAIGKTTSTGRVTLLAPTHVVAQDAQEARIDGVLFEFQLVPETEAPAELNFLLPERRALCVVETASHTLHNILTIRGAPVRDALWWSKCLDVSRERFAGRADVLFGGHHWPTFGSGEIERFLSAHRDLYRFLHDQTLRLANLGLTGPEIAEALELPQSLSSLWHTRGHYGSVRHNARAVYQRYFGVYDGNPVNLDPLPPEQAGRRYVEALGGPARVVELAREALEEGDERWAATLASHAVFADAGNASAREVEADALEQLGYQTENATWRNAYLQGAHELREGPVSAPTDAGGDVVRAIATAQLFDALGVRMDGLRAAEQPLVLNWDFPDIAERWVLRVQHGALSYAPGEPDPEADATVRLDRETLNRVMLGESDAIGELQAGRITIEGDGEKLGAFLGLLVAADPGFAIVTP